MSVRGDGRPILLIMGLGGNIEMWDPLGELHARGFQTIAYDAPEPALATRLVPLATRPRPPGCPPPGHSRPARRPRARRVAGAAAQELALRNPHRVRRLILASTSCGLGGVPGPLAIGLLATPLRYYSPRFLQATARWMYGPIADPDGRLMHQQVNARRSTTPDDVGLPEPALRIAGWTSLPWLQRIAAPTLVVTGGKDPIVPPVNARILDPGFPAQPSTSCPTPGTCCSWTTPSSART